MDNDEKTVYRVLALFVGLVLLFILMTGCQTVFLPDDYLACQQACAENGGTNAMCKAPLGPMGCRCEDGTIVWREDGG